MLRTNTKKAITNLQQYIINNYTPDGYDDAPATTDSFQTIAAYIYNTFIDEVGGWYVKNGRGSYQEAFEYWTAGLPSILDCLYHYNRSAIDDLGSILEENEAEKAQFQEWEAEAKLTYLIYRTLSTANR